MDLEILARAELQALVSLPRREKERSSLEEVLARRRSQRRFLDRLLSLEQISQLLWAAQGMTHPAGMRTAPSAGRTVPIGSVTSYIVKVYVPRDAGAD
jgi:hypothetical protein